MAIRDLALLGLVVFWGQPSSAARIGLRLHWQRQLNETLPSRYTLVTAESPLPPPPVNIDGSAGTDPTLSSQPDDSPSVESSLESTESPDDNPLDVPGQTPSQKPNEPTAAPDPSDPGDYNESPSSDGENGASPSESLVASDDGAACTSLAPGEIKTVVSIIYTETITWTGDPSDYTPAYPTLEIPTYCDSVRGSPTTVPPAIPTSLADGGSAIDSVTFETACITQADDMTVCYTETYFNPSFVFNSELSTSNPHPITLPFYEAPGEGIRPSLTSTFFVTSKNPSVVFPPVQTPDYGAGKSVNGNGGGGKNTHRPADSDQTPSAGGKNTQKPADGDQTPRPPYQSMLATDLDKRGVIITAEPTRVIIDDRTISNINPTATTRVTVGNAVYEINPSQIIQLGGKTIDRGLGGQGLYVATPTSAVIDGLSIVVSGPSAVIGGYTYTIGRTAETQVVQGRTVVISPSGITVKNKGAGITYDAKIPEQTGVIVAGGELMTAIGKSVVVLMQTTITYGVDVAPQTETVDDDTIVIGPSYVAVHGTTIGGDRLGTSQTKYDIVGGATLTQIGASKAVIKGTTFTVGPGTGTTTTFVGGETITIAPEGLTVGTLTLPYPFGPTIVTMLPTPTRTAAPSVGEDEEDAGMAFRPNWTAGITSLCIAIGVWALGFVI